MTAATEALTPIWLRILQRAAVRLDDNFFDLGGDPLKASALFAEIARVFARELSPLTIYQAPTIAKLAGILQCSAQPRIEPVVELRAGSHGPPVFLEHGLGGSVAEFFEVLKHVESNRPMYGLQMKGIDGIEKPLDRIEEIARLHLEVIRSVQPHGPYTFIGYSFGGLTTFEMSRILLEQMNEVALLVMVDSFPHLRCLPFGQQTAVVKRRLKRYASARLGANKNSSAYRSGGGAPDRPQFGERFTRIMQTVSDNANEALSRYRPRVYKDKVKFVKAAISTEFADDPLAIWSKLTTGVDVETVPGDHFGILAGYSSNLAHVLSRYLKGTA